MRVRPLLCLAPLEDRCTPATFVVTSLADSGVGTLRDAIAQAESDFAADTIVFDPSIQGGTIELTTFDSGLGSGFGPTAFRVTTNITIQGSGETVLRAAGAPAFRLFTVQDNETGGRLTLSDLELSGGLARGGDGFDGGGGAGGFGGAILTFAPLTLRGVTLSGNTAQGGDGGVGTFFDGGGGGVGETPTNFNGGGPNGGTSNFPFGGFGGGGAAGSEANGGSGGFGGGGGANNSSGVAGNGGFGGGGGASDNLSSNGFGGFGGGDGDTAVGGGGGAGMGGAVFNYRTSVTVENSTFSGNAAVAGSGGAGNAEALGGGLFNYNGTVTVRSSTFTQNVAADGGRQVFALGQFSGPSGVATTDLQNSVLGQADVLVTDFVGDGIDDGASSTTGSGNLIRTAVGFQGSIISSGDPLLGPLADNGGLTRTHLPLAGSPALDAVAGSAAGGLTLDQRGLPRVVNGDLDIGSVEVQPPPPVVPPPVVPPVTPPLITYLVGVGADVQVRDADGSLLRSIPAFDPAAVTGTVVAYADVNGDGVLDAIAGVGAGGEARVRVYNGISDTSLFDFDAFPGFRGGVSVAAADLTGDGVAELVVGAGVGGSPHVKVFDLSAGRPDLIKSFYAYVPEFRGGVNVAATTGFLVATAGPGGGPHVKVYLGLTDVVIASFFAFAPDFNGGVVAAVGDLNGDGIPDLVVGKGQFGGPEIAVFDATTASRVSDFLAYDPGFRGGVSVAIQDVNGDGLNDFVFWAGPGGGPHVIVRDARTLELFSSYYATADTFRQGIRVA